MQQEEENPGSFSAIDWRDSNKRPAQPTNKFTASYEEEDDEG